jgi:hypothetical protein
MCIIIVLNRRTHPRNLNLSWRYHSPYELHFRPLPAYRWRLLATTRVIRIVLLPSGPIDLSVKDITQAPISNMALKTYILKCEKNIL